MHNDENPRLTDEVEPLSPMSRELLEKIDREAKAYRREQTRHATRSPLFEGMSENGEPTQLVMAQVVATFETTRYLQVNMTTLAVRLSVDESERFRVALREWLS